MKQPFLIWFFSLLLLVSLKAPCVQAQGSVELQFQEFPLGISYNTVKYKLAKYKTTLNDFSSHYFKMELPVYKILSSFKGAASFLDAKRQRVYYDEEVFFDLKDLVLKNSNYNFFYDKPYYFLTFQHVRIVSVDYPSRVNPKLTSLKFKFFKNTLYSIEYATTLKDYELRRFRLNYIKNYGAILLDDNNYFQNNSGHFFISIHEDHMNDNSVSVILMGKKEYPMVRDYLDKTINQLFVDLSDYLNKTLGSIPKAKFLILQDRKNDLIRKIHKKYGSVDEL